MAIHFHPLRYVAQTALKPGRVAFRRRTKNPMLSSVLIEGDLDESVLLRGESLRAGWSEQMGVAVDYRSVGLSHWVLACFSFRDGGIAYILNNVFGSLVRKKCADGCDAIVDRAGYCAAGAS